MKAEYSSPSISVETLIKQDILCMSETPATKPIEERENAYSDIMDLITSGDWFS